MEKFILDKFGLGLNTTTNPTLLPAGQARIAKNMDLPNGNANIVLRRGINRTWHTRPANAPVLGLHQYTANTGTRTPLAQINGVLYSWSLTPGSLTSVDSGHQSTNIPRFSQALNFWLEADYGDANYIGNATNGYPLQIAAPAATLTATNATGAGSMALGTYKYQYSRYSSITGEISPASGSAISVTLSGGNNQVTLQVAALTTTEQFDSVRIWRTKVGTTAPYYEHPVHSIVSVANIVAGITDQTADASLTTLSSVHTSAGAVLTEKPVAGHDLCFHRGRIHIITANTSRQCWSQLNSFSFDNGTDSEHYVEQDDGDWLRRIFSYGSTLVLMKDHSIHVMNGDINEQSFTWQVASDLQSGIGAYCPFTAVATPIGIIFQGECGVYLFRPGMPRPQFISGDIQSDLESLDYSRRLFFVAGFNNRTRSYQLAVTPSGETTNTTWYNYYIDDGVWLGPHQYGMGKIKVSSFATIHNSSNEQKIYVGDSNGYSYETEVSTGNDGVTSGTETGTATGGAATELQDSTAAFRTAGDGLRGIPATLQVSGTVYETQEISSNTGTALTTATWSTTPSNQTYYVGAIEGILSLGRLDCGSAGYKRFLRLNFEFESNPYSSSSPLIVGFTMDGDSQPTTIETVTGTSIFRCSLIVNRIGIGLSPYIRVIGTDVALEILKIEVEYVDFAGRLPRA